MKLKAYISGFQALMRTQMAKFSSVLDLPETLFLLEHFDCQTTQSARPIFMGLTYLTWQQWILMT